MARRRECSWRDQSRVSLNHLIWSAPFTLTETIRHCPHCNKLGGMSPRPTNMSSKGNEAIGGVFQGSVVGPILFVFYVNDLSGYLPADSLFCADDVTLIALRNRHDILQSSPNTSWSTDWELGLNPTKSEHLSVFNSARFVLPSRNPSNTNPKTFHH